MQTASRFIKRHKEINRNLFGIFCKIFERIGVQTARNYHKHTDRGGAGSKSVEKWNRNEWGVLGPGLLRKWAYINAFLLQKPHSFLFSLSLKILLSPLSKMFIFNLMNVTGKFNKLAGNFIEFAGIFKSSPENS
jgi:hypothetical protein